MGEVGIMHLKRFIAIFAALLVMFAFIAPVSAEDTEEVGPKFAVRIIEHRQKYGPFKLTEELMEIRGIGPGTYDKIRDQIIAQ
jgi:competence ComEA-like helix-hairpin-helix protein